MALVLSIMLAISIDRLKEIKKITEKTVIIITHKEAALEVCNKEIIIKDKILHVKNI